MRCQFIFQQWWLWFFDKGRRRRWWSNDKSDWLACWPHCFGCEVFLFNVSFLLCVGLRFVWAIIWLGEVVVVVWMFVPKTAISFCGFSSTLIKEICNFLAIILSGHGVGVVPSETAWKLTDHSRLWSAHVRLRSHLVQTNLNRFAAEQICTIHGRLRTVMIGLVSMLFPKGQDHPRFLSYLMYICFVSMKLLPFWQKQKQKRKNWANFCNSNLQ